jgi:hypothetical protein
MLTAVVFDSDLLNCGVVVLCVVVTGSRLLSGICSRSFSQGIAVGARIVIAVFVGFTTVLIGSLRVPHYSVLCCSSFNGTGEFITMIIEHLMAPEVSLPYLQSLLWNQKIHDCVYKACYISRRFITVLTKTRMEPEDLSLCLQSLLWIQKIYYRVYKASS